MNDFGTLMEKIRVYRPDSDEAKIRSAFDFASKIHTNQWRKTGEPYFVHVYKTALFLTDLHADDDTICAALLHDAVEESGVTFAEIKTKFGDTVVKLVQGVTKVSKVKYRDRMEERQIISLRKMFVSMANDIRVIIIRLADRLHNMQTLHGVRPDKQLRIARETLEIYCPLANLLGIWYLRWQLEDLCFKYLNSTEYQKIDRFFGEYKQGSEIYIDKLKKQIEDELKQRGIDCIIEGRSKHYYSIYQKIKKQHRRPEEVYDIFAIRIILTEKENCYRVLGIIHSLWRPRFNRFKDYIAVPKSNGYQSIHTTVFGPEGKNVEIQIRTAEMHEEAEFGVASHWFYKHDLSPHRLKKNDWINQLLSLQKAQKDHFDFVENLKVDILRDRIFVFNPKGEIMDLPQGATALDFAYSIHSDLGNHFKEAVVNGTICTAGKQLQTGDNVEIKTLESIRPELSWIKYAKISKTKELIRSFVYKETNDNKTMMGKKILAKVLEREGRQELEKFLHHKNLPATLKIFNLENEQDLLKNVCEEKINPLDFVKAVYKKEGVIGKIFALKRNPAGSSLQLVTVEVTAPDRIGILGDITTNIAQEGVNIASSKIYKNFGSDKFKYVSRIEVPSFQILENVFELLEKIEGVESVKRILYPFKRLFYGLFMPFLFLCAHFATLMYLKVDLFLFYLSFLVPASAFYVINRFIDSETSFSFRKIEVFMINLMIAVVGNIIAFWEISVFGVALSWHAAAYIFALHSFFLIFKTGYYLYYYFSHKGRMGFLLFSGRRKKKFIKEKILIPDKNSSRYRKISDLYEKYLFTTYQENYIKYNSWKDHFCKIHDQINLMLSEYDDLSEKIVAIAGCGPAPGDRDFDTGFVNLLKSGGLKKVVLIDFSKLTLISAIDNLLNKGVPLNRIQAYQIDLTGGIGAYFADILTRIHNGECLPALENMKDDLITRMEEIVTKDLAKLEEEDRFDFFISSMFATSTLFPIIYGFKEKIRRFKRLSPEEKKKILASCDDFENAYNTYMLSFTTNYIVGLGREKQRGLVIVDTEKIFKGTKKVVKTIAGQINDLPLQIPAISDYEMCHWLWQDECDHYHVIHSMTVDVDKSNSIDKAR